MRRAPAAAAAALALTLAGAAPALAQGYTLRLDFRGQNVSYRGLTADSVLQSQTVAGSSGGRFTADGFAVSCQSGIAYCSYYRPGPRLNGGPFVSSANLNMWGLGVRGLSLHGEARVALDLGDSEVWPGTTPAVQLFEGYAQYASSAVTARLGRIVVSNRLGFNGFDGARVAVRVPKAPVEVSAYGGWSLAQATALPVTSPVLNPLDQYQPRERFLTAGGSVSLQTAPVELRVDAIGEMDPEVDYVVQQRVAGSGTLRPARNWAITGGAEYQFDYGQWGTADLSVRYTVPRLAVIVGARRYRPHFDLWTIWGAFSPTPHEAVNASVAWTAVPRLQLRARGEAYRFDDSEAETALATYDSDGWRGAAGATWSFARAWTVDAGYQVERGPGASSSGFEGYLTYTPDQKLSLALTGASLQRPLEYRWSTSNVFSLGVDAQYRPTSQVALGLNATRYDESRDRPDAAQFDWDQFRVSARVTLLFTSAADRVPLPRATRRPAGR